MSKRIDFSSWGTDLMMPQYAVDDEVHSRAECVAAAVARRNKICVISVNSDGFGIYSNGERKPHYHITLGRPLRTGGYTDIRNFWIEL